MRINNIGPTSANNIRKKGKAGAAGDFASLMASEETTEKAAVGASIPIDSLSALLAAQMVDSDEPRKRQINHGKDLLEYLDDLRLDILSGGVNLGTVQKLLKEVRNQVGEITDPKLAAIIGDIEIRAAVELAKVEMSAINRLPK